jgi:hypothetical protein
MAPIDCFDSITFTSRINSSPLSEKYRKMIHQADLWKAWCADAGVVQAMAYLHIMHGRCRLNQRQWSVACTPLR